MRIFILFICFLIAFFNSTYSHDISAIDNSFLDVSVSPADDFYQYANGSWIIRSSIRENSVGLDGFSELSQRHAKALFGLLVDAAKDSLAPDGSYKKIVGALLRSANDHKKLNKDGITPLNPLLSKIDSIETITDLQRVVAKMHRYDLDVFWNFRVGRDLKVNKNHTVYIGQMDFGLPSVEYYLKNDDESKSLQDDYKSYVSNILILSGENEKNARQWAEAIYEFEKALARVSLSRVERDKVDKYYKKISVSVLQNVVTEINWKVYLDNIHVESLDSVVISDERYLFQLNKLLLRTPIITLKKYMKWYLLSSTGDFLSDPFVNENFNFYRKRLEGQQKIDPRYKRTIEHTIDLLDEIVTPLYLEQAFNKESLKKVNDIIDQVIVAYSELINESEWLSEQAKSAAVNKLNKVTRKIGYPANLPDYRHLKSEGNSYVANVFQILEFFHHRSISKIGKTVDIEEWTVSPLRPNAYYDPTLNEIIITATYLQPPAFFKDEDLAVDYGTLGFTIGHELTHAFFNGSQFDETGVLRKWLTETDEKKIEQKAKLLKMQYESVEVYPGCYINGELTLYENIADLEGIRVAFRAYKNSMKGKEERSSVNFFPSDQRFFLSYAQSQRRLLREEYQKKQLHTDTHSPSKYRVNVPLSNMDEFHDSFKVKMGDRMYRNEKERVRIW